jgi:hypothetical protein
MQQVNYIEKGLSIEKNKQGGYKRNQTPQIKDLLKTNEYFALCGDCDRIYLTENDYKAHLYPVHNIAN